VIECVTKKNWRQLDALADAVSVSAGEDKVHGTRVTIRVTPAAGASNEAIEGKIAAIFCPIYTDVFIEFE
jgi:hypothetical protein